MSRLYRLLPAALLIAVAAILAGQPEQGPPHPAAFGAFGAAGSPVVLVHGLGSRSADWLPVARRLAPHHRVVLVELPGHGGTDMTEPSLDAAARAVDLGIAAETREPVVLVGHSIGGLVATAVALRDPRRVRGLVLVETALTPQVDDAGRASIRAALDHGYDALLRSVYQAFGRDSAQGAALYAEAAANDSTAMKEWIRLAILEDLSRAAAGLRCPVLAVLAERSWPLDEPWPVTSRALGLDHIARLEPRRFRDCGHFVMLDRPADVAAAIDRFARSLDAAPQAAAIP